MTIGPPSVTIARPSVASLLLVPQSNQADLGTATGFVVKEGATAFLVTNWHVLTGRHPATGKPLRPDAAVPNEVVILHNVAGHLGRWMPVSEHLYDGGGQPRWREHPIYGRRVDVVALRLDHLTGVDIYEHTVNEDATSGVALGVARGLSIVGFPFGLTGGGAAAIWVQGNIATEPTLNFDDLPSFLIDSRTREGQSGSPVIFYTDGGVVQQANGTASFVAGPVEQLIGVYSGRVNSQSDLGLVWKAEVVRDIIQRGAPGST